MPTFDEYFKSVYSDRWKNLREALVRESHKSERAFFENFSTYTLDEASVIAAKALGVKTGDQVLDMCAAPGGKTLVLLEALEGRGSLVANELSSDRRRRLKQVIEEHVPEKFQKCVQITGYDGNQFGLKRAGEFDRVLLDAPCSSERHQLEDDSEQKDWKLSKSEGLARRQYSLICAAVLALKPGGTLVYSTCSISPIENDGVIERVLKRKSDQVEIDSDISDLTTLEKTKFGFQIFPDVANGIGPIYFSRLKKIGPTIL